MKFCIFPALCSLLVFTAVVGCGPLTQEKGPSANNPPAVNNPPPEINPEEPPENPPEVDPAAKNPSDPPADPDPQPDPNGPAEPQNPPGETIKDPGDQTGGGEKHEPLFVNWPQPEVALYITGRQRGYIEPCGCTGLANQKGGLARKHTLYQQLLEKEWPVVPIDAGNQVRRFGRQAEIKFQMTIEGLKTMGFAAIGLGADDLRLTSGELLAVTASTDDHPSPFVSASAAILDRSVTPEIQVVETGKHRLGITSVLGEEELKRAGSDEVPTQPTADVLPEIVEQLKAAECDFLVLICHATLEESRKFAADYPDFNLIITTGGGGEPTRLPEKIEGSKGVMIQVGDKGMYAGVVGIFDDEEKPLRYQRVPLDDRFADSPAMLEVLASYQDQLQALGLAGLGIRPVKHPSGNTFVGSETCADCHSTAYDIWKETPHFHATESLVHPGERSEIPRHFDPECLSCHVTGWNPQNYYPYETGYLDLEKSKAMHGSGCENCHGPGSAHVAAENGDIDADDAMLKTLREGMRLPLAQAERQCMECHDLDNSPDFHKPGAFEKYWKRVEHIGLD